MLNADVAGPASIDIYDATAFVCGQPEKLQQRATVNQADLDGWIGEGVQVSLDLQFAIYVDFQRRWMRPSRRQARGQNERINGPHPIWDNLVQQPIKVHCKYYCPAFLRSSKNAPARTFRTPLPEAKRRCYCTGCEVRCRCPRQKRRQIRNKQLQKTSSLICPCCAGAMGA